MLLSTSGLQENPMPIRNEASINVALKSLRPTQMTTTPAAAGNLSVRSPRVWNR